LPSEKYSVFSADTHPTRALQFWYRLPLAVAALLMAAPLLVALWSMVGSNLEVKRKRLQQEEESSVARASHLSAESLKTLFVSADLVLLELRGYWQNHPNEFHGVLKSRHDKLQLGSSFDVFVVNAGGKVVRSSSPAHVLRDNLNYSPPVSRHKDDSKDRLLMGPAFYDSITERWQLPFTRRLLSSSGKFEGIMVFLVQPDYFNVLALQATRLKNNSVFSIIDMDTGDLILRSIKINRQPTAQAPSKTSPDFWSFLKLGIPAADSGVMVSQLPLPIDRLSDSELVRLNTLPHSGRSRRAFEIDQVERLYAWQKLERIPLQVTIGTPASHLDNALATEGWRHFIIGSTFSLLVLVFATGFNLYDRTRRRSRQALAASEQALRQLAAHQTDLLEEERKLISREIHDDLGQRLSVLRLDLAVVMSAMQSTSGADLVARVAKLKDAIDDILRATRDLAKKVRPPSLDIGFLPAIEALCDEFQDRLPFMVRFVNNADITIQPDNACAIAAYRILQESLTNATRYAQCQHIDISLAVHDDWLYLRVIDDGVGFDPTANKPGRRTFGLLSMRERVAALHGDMRIRSQPGQGCKLLFMLPLNSAAADNRTVAVCP
jgi:signal transduction histidine kinase